MIPKHLAPLFWDIDLAAFDPRLHPAYTIGRVFEYGDSEAVAWMRQSFAEAQIMEVLRKEHRLSVRSANFWALVLHVPASDVASLSS